MKLLIIDDEPSFGNYLALILSDVFKHDVSVAGGYNEASRIPQQELSAFDIAFIDMKMPMVDGFQTGLRLKKLVPGIVTIMLTAYPSVEKVISALRDHQFDDFLIKEDLEDVENYSQLKNALHRAENLSAARRALTDEYQLSNALRSRYTDVFSDIIGDSAALQQIKRLVARVAPSDTTVMVSGETGTGKELIAREIHHQSRRRHKPFIPINCSAIPSGLLESELFGHKRGAFTGAVGNREGYFRLAEGGTLFLDEIGDMPAELQSKLLRVLEDRQYFPVGSSRLSDTVKVDVRIISASHQDLQKKTEIGEFRQDLLYRLNTMILKLPPLRERIGDIEALVSCFMARNPAAERIRGISGEALEMLKQWPWPGNVRELQNMMERAVLLCEGERLECSHFPAELRALGNRPKSNVSFGFQRPATVSIQEPRPVWQDRGGGTDDHERLWENFRQNGFKLWTFSNQARVTEVLRSGLQGSCYRKKGHSARLIVARDFELDVEVRYINASTRLPDDLVVRFVFGSERSADRKLARTSGTRREPGALLIQPVVKGQPDTYLFNLLYPPQKRNDLSPFPSQRLIRALLLRYALNRSGSGTLKSVFEQTMTYLMEEEMVSLVEGLTVTGLEAMRAYLCGADHIFSGMARKLKSETNIVEAEIRSFFPEYHL